MQLHLNVYKQSGEQRFKLQLLLRKHTFLRVGKLGTFGVPIRIFRDTEQISLNPTKTGTNEIPTPYAHKPSGACVLISTPPTSTQLR